VRVNHFVSVQTIWVLETLAERFQKTQGKEIPSPIHRETMMFAIMRPTTGSTERRCTLLR
jgi:hypothetical protein